MGSQTSKPIAPQPTKVQDTFSEKSYKPAPVYRLQDDNGDARDDLAPVTANSIDDWSSAFEQVSLQPLFLG